ncbi:MAG: Tad domain-containing protein [Anaerolineae bacterium]|nr:Tad domain-containing protein [Anaerolineae bacterium]
MKDEKGQAIVLVAFAIIALAAVIGLAIDGGRLYQSRRQVQNAADAAALAGTRLLTDGLCGTSVNPANVVNAIVEFAAQNGVVFNPLDPAATPDARIEAWYVDANETRIGVVGTTVPSTARGIAVSLQLTQTTTFMRILGHREIMAPGTATAMFGPVVQMPAGSKVLPIAVPDDVVVGMPPGTKFTVENDVFCQVHAAQCIGDAGDASSQRGWLNFDYIYNTVHYTEDDPLRRTHKPTTNANDILQFIIPSELGGREVPPIFLGTPPIPSAPAIPTTLYIDGDFIHGEPGQKQSDSKAVFDYYPDQLVYLPVFDVVYAPNYMDDNNASFPDPYVDSGQTWPNQNQYLYHIIGFAGVQVCNENTDSDCDNNTEQKELVGTFRNLIIGQGQIDPSIPINGCDATVVGLTLWK